MPTRVLLVASPPERGRALHRLTRLTAAAWREGGASVHVIEPGGRRRAALRRAVLEADVVHLMDLRDATLLPEDPGPARRVAHCHDLGDLMDDLGRGEGQSRRPHPFRRRQASSVVHALRRLDGILVTSRYTAEQMRRLTGHQAELLHPPVDPALAERPGRLDAWKPPAWPYLLTLGGPGRRERRDAAITAWAHLRRTQSLDGASLVVVGPPLTDREDAMVVACGGHVTVLQDVTDAQLGALYQRSRAVLALGQPAGFVWPIAEAHQAGRPVLATDHPLFEETGQSGCVYLPVEGIDRFDAGTWTSIAEDLTARVVADRGAVNAERFAWRLFVDRLPVAVGARPRSAVDAPLPASMPAPITSLPESVAAEVITVAPRKGPWMPEVISLPTPQGAGTGTTRAVPDQVGPRPVGDSAAQQQVPLTTQR